MNADQMIKGEYYSLNDGEYIFRFKYINDKYVFIMDDYLWRNNLQTNQTLNNELCLCDFNNKDIRKATLDEIKLLNFNYSIKRVIQIY